MEIGSVFNRVCLSPKLLIGDAPIEYARSYNYLGVIIQCNRFSNEMRDNAVAKGRRCAFSLIGSILTNNLNLTTAFRVFDQAVSPLMLYGAEFWGMPNFGSKTFDKYLPFIRLDEVLKNNPTENVHLRFMKTCLGLQKYVTTDAVYGEAGRYPLYIRIFRNMLNFLHHIKSSDANSLVFNAYKANVELADNGMDSWCLNFRNILKYYGLENTFNADDNAFSVKQFEVACKNQFEFFWSHSIQVAYHRGGKLELYAKLKPHFGYEKYLELPFKFRRALGKFRTSNHRLRIETGRHCSPIIIREDRLCKYCLHGVVENKVHFLFECPYYRFERMPLIEQWINIFGPQFMYLPVGDRLVTLLNSDNLEILSQLAKFVNLASDRINDKICGWTGN